MRAVTLTPPLPVPGDRAGAPGRSAPPGRAVSIPTERGPRGPRLLLPPVSEPESATEALAETVLASPALRSVLSPVTEEAWPVPAANPATRVARRLPDPEQLCGSVVLAAVEVLTGTRPITQLARWVTPRVLDALTARLGTTDQDSRRGPGSGGPVTAPIRTGAGRPRTVPTPRATVRRVMLSRIDDRTAEACVVLHDGARVRAAAARLQVHRGHWRVTVLQIG